MYPQQSFTFLQKRPRQLQFRLHGNRMGFCHHSIQWVFTLWRKYAYNLLIKACLPISYLTCNHVFQSVASHLWFHSAGVAFKPKAALLLCKTLQTNTHTHTQNTHTHTRLLPGGPISQGKGGTVRHTQPSQTRWSETISLCRYVHIQKHTLAHSSVTRQYAQHLRTMVANDWWLVVGVEKRVGGGRTV